MPLPLRLLVCTPVVLSVAVAPPWLLLLSGLHPHTNATNASKIINVFIGGETSWPRRVGYRAKSCFHADVHPISGPPSRSRQVFWSTLVTSCPDPEKEWKAKNGRRRACSGPETDAVGKRMWSPGLRLERWAFNKHAHKKTGENKRDDGPCHRTHCSSKGCMKWKRLFRQCPRR